MVPQFAIESGIVSRRITPKGYFFVGTNIAPKGMYFIPELQRTEPLVFETRHTVFHVEGTMSLTFMEI